ncbi:phage integrase N-terminal SAM-like domain-containing protein [Stutzerimonas nitrititolerans]|uniref:phage integrase N-terminal SAM-like domain-containing protein n=1 Tax=Stutzerimonas nitrititolerans TaxID=2482751 RepID=UPI0035E45A5E
MISRELNHKLHLYKSKGGKTSRKRNVERIKEFIRWCKCSPHQTGKKHIHDFFNEKRFSASTARDYWYAINVLWQLMDRAGTPPKPLIHPKNDMGQPQAETRTNSHFDTDNRSARVRDA